MNILRFCFLALATFCCWGLSARDIYVSPTGNDRNPGTKEQPLASLSGARDVVRNLRATENLQGEVRVVIADGTYFMYEPVLFTDLDSGSEDAPLTFTAEEGATPVFVGGIAIDNWEKVSDKLWKAHVPEVRRYGLYFEQLYVNGQRAHRAKSPNQGFYSLKNVDETIIDRGEGRSAAMAVQRLGIFPQAAADVATFSESDFNDALVVLYHKWDNTRKRIAHYDADSSAIVTVGKGMKPWNPLNNQTRFTIDNFRAALDTAGEWYLERSGDLYYRPRAGETLANTKVYAPVTERFVVLKGDSSNGQKVQHIRFENLRFEVAGYRTPLWGNEPAQAAAPVDAVILADFAHKIAFVNCEISHTGTYGIWFREACTDCTVSHCYLHDLGAGGIKIGSINIPPNESEVTRGITIDNNIIRSGGYVFPCAVGVILFQASDNQITHNEIANFRYSGVSVGWVWGYAHSPSKRNTIEYNHIHHLGWGELSDMGGVYCLGGSEGTSVSNNVIHHIYAFDYGGWGLYTDEGSTGILMENNLVYACKNSGFHQHYGKENTIRNNIFAANLKAQLQATRVEEHLSFNFTNNIIWFDTGSLLSSRWGKINIHSDHNLYWDARAKAVRFDTLSFEEWQASGKDRNSIIADPGFANPSAFDFRIKDKALLQKIGFQPVDVSKAGVYGSQAWIERAKLAPAVVARYDKTVERLMARDER